MIPSLGYVLGHTLEYVLFIYFASTSFYPRKNYIYSGVISLCGYAALFLVGLLGKAPVSILAFFVVNSILIVYCYNVKLSNAVFYSLILDALSCIGEYMILYLLGIRYIDSWHGIINNDMIVVAIGGKIIYLIGVKFLKRFTNEKSAYETETQMVIMTVPVLTIICLTMLMTIEIDNLVFLFICIVFLLINFTTFYVNTGLNNKNHELKILQEEYNKNKAELSEYELLADKYENTKIMRHDFHKQLDALKELIGEDNIRAKEYMRQMEFSQRELDYAQYTDNKILNILFAQKIKESHTRGAEIHIQSEKPTLSFISDIDTVAIFSNMLDNAIEAAEKADNKEIYVDLYTVNNAYAAVRIENYTDKEPVVLDGVLSTQKQDAELHGMGIKSINNALKKYNSELSWSYDKEKKFFRALALIHIPSERNNV